MKAARPAGFKRDQLYRWACRMEAEMAQATEITFEVDGDPIPQPRPRVSTWGGRGRAYVPKNHRIHAYREAIKLLAQTSGWQEGPLEAAMAVEVDCYFRRPASHLTAAGKVKLLAPWRPKADVDNLAKGILDAITDSRAFWVDDDQVVELTIRKSWAPPKSAGRTIVTVRRA